MKLSIKFTSQKLKELGITGVTMTVKEMEYAVKEFGSYDTETTLISDQNIIDWLKEQNEKNERLEPEQIYPIKATKGERRSAKM